LTKTRAGRRCEAAPANELFVVWFANGKANDSRKICTIPPFFVAAALKTPFDSDENLRPHDVKLI